MSVPARLVSFAAGLAIVFGASYLIAGAAVPERVVDDWTRSAEESERRSDVAHDHTEAGR